MATRSNFSTGRNAEIFLNPEKNMLEGVNASLTSDRDSRRRNSLRTKRSRTSFWADSSPSIVLISEYLIAYLSSSKNSLMNIGTNVLRNSLFLSRMTTTRITAKTAATIPAPAA